MVISDWTDENPRQVLANLKKDGDYYAPKKGTVTSWWGAFQKGNVGDYFQAQWTRMGTMDLSDVGYDAFFINGKEKSNLITLNKGETLRIRIINAGASSFFIVNIANLPFKVVATDGIDVKPVEVTEFLMGMGETYDILFTAPENNSFELRATAQDITGYASTFIGTGPKILVPLKEKPNLYKMMMMDHMMDGMPMEMPMDHGDHPMEMPMDHGDHPMEMPMDHDDHPMEMPMDHDDHPMEMPMDHDDHPMEMPMDHGDHPMEMPMDHGDHPMEMPMDHDNHPMKMPLKMGAPKKLAYHMLRAAEKTSLPKDASVFEFEIELAGNMERYVWTLNGTLLSEDKYIEIKKGDIVRLKMVNTTMMHHPMHLHGHFFRLLNGQKDFAPLKHTVDVAPMKTEIIEFFASETGVWLFHCHNLYHMSSGMTKVFKYKDFETPAALIQAQKQSTLMKDSDWYSYVQLEAYNNFFHSFIRYDSARIGLELDLEVEEYDPDTLQADLFFRRHFSRFMSVFTGSETFNQQSFGVLGVSYIVPLNFETALLINHEGKWRIDIDKMIQLTSNLFTELETKIRENSTEFEISLGYQFNWSTSLTVRFSGGNTGVGLLYKF